MASSEEIAPLLPETLPEDFGDWDSEASAAPSHALTEGREGWKAGPAFGGPRRPVPVSERDPRPLSRDGRVLRFREGLAGRLRL